MDDPKSPKYKQIRLVLFKDDPKSPRYLKRTTPRVPETFKLKS